MKEMCSGCPRVGRCATILVNDNGIDVKKIHTSPMAITDCGNRAMKKMGLINNALVTTAISGKTTGSVAVNVMPNTSNRISKAVKIKKSSYQRRCNRKSRMAVFVVKISSADESSCICECAVEVNMYCGMDVKQ